MVVSCFDWNAKDVRLRRKSGFGFVFAKNPSFVDAVISYRYPESVNL